MPTVCASAVVFPSQEVANKAHGVLGQDHRFQVSNAMPCCRDKCHYFMLVMGPIATAQAALKQAGITMEAQMLQSVCTL